MKNFTKFLSVTALSLLTSLAVFAQPVSDNAVIPVAVTLNPVLRLTVVSGGNIEFVFNKIDDYKAGIANSDNYDTNITISSSQDWDLVWEAEDLTFLGTNDPANTLPLDNVGCAVEQNGVHADATEVAFAYSAAAPGAIPALGASEDLITNAAQSAGDAADNDFILNWECGTSTGANMNATSILEQSITPDRYVVNVLLTLELN